VKKEKNKKEGKEEEDKEAKKTRRSKDPKKVREQLAKIETRVKNYDAKIAVKEDTKQVALGTSKINYMDPRITVAWCKSKEVPIEKIFSKALLQKFPWAMEVPSTWRFDKSKSSDQNDKLKEKDDDDDDEDKDEKSNDEDEDEE